MAVDFIMIKVNCDHCAHSFRPYHLLWSTTVCEVCKNTIENEFYQQELKKEVSNLRNIYATMDADGGRFNTAANVLQERLNHD